MLRRRRQSHRGTPPIPRGGRFGIAILVATVVLAACGSGKSENRADRHV